MGRLHERPVDRVCAVSYNDAIDYQANVFASYNSTPYFIFTEVYDPPLNYDTKTGAPDPKNSPAYKYTVSPDGKTITYYLRRGCAGATASR